MNINKKQFDNERKFNLSDKFMEDIKNLYGASAKVPSEVDRAILDKASQKLTRPRTNFHVLRWIGPAAAAAAIIIIALVFVNQSTPADIDRNGRVDILDAFKLAKQIQTENKPDKKWDINGDGLVNQGDVDFVASAAVSLNKGV
jgi:hypothetical protein